jgi:hypothetical protein
MNSQGRLLPEKGFLLSGQRWDKRVG